MIKYVLVALVSMVVGGLLGMFTAAPVSKIENLEAQITSLQAEKAAILAANQAQICIRAENAVQEEKNAASLQKIEADALSDCDYYAALVRLLREAGGYCPGGSSAGVAEGLPGPGF